MSTRIVIMLVVLSFSLSLSDAQEPRSVTIENSVISVTFTEKDAKFSIHDKRNGATWKQILEGSLLSSVRIVRTGKNFIFARLVWHDTPVLVDLTLFPDTPDLHVRLAARNHSPMKDNLIYPYPFVTAPAYGSLVINAHSGYLMPMHTNIFPHGFESPETEPDAAYRMMDWFGLTDTRMGIMAIALTPYDARFPLHQITSSLEPFWIQRIEWKPVLDVWGYNRELIYSVVDKDGYVALAKRYRRFLIDFKKFVPLKKKTDYTSDVVKLAGAVDIWLWEDARTPEFIREIKRSGIEKALIHCGRGSTAFSKKLLDAIDKAGYLASLEIPGIASSPGNNTPTTTTASYKGCMFTNLTSAPLFEQYSGDIPTSRSVDSLQRKNRVWGSLISHKIVGGVGINSWFVPFGHYLEGGLSSNAFKTESKRAGYPSTDFTADMSIADCYTSPQLPKDTYQQLGLSPANMIPTFELVAHDMICSSWDRRDSNHRVVKRWQRKNLFNVLYGNMPLWHLTREIWENGKEHFLKSYKLISEWTSSIAFDEMTDHTWLSRDGLVQMTRWSSGRYVIVNFGHAAVTTEDGKTIPARSFVTYRE